MAKSASIKKMGITHTAILDFMVANPTVSKGDVAKTFNVTQSWLSIIINSDAFQDALALRNDEFFGTSVVPLREKLLGIAENALDRVDEHIGVMKPELAVETADKLLHRLGYAPNTKQGGQAGAVNLIQNNVYNVPAETLQRAQASFGKATKNVERETQLIEQDENDGTAENGKGLELPSPETVQSGGGAGVGEALVNGAELCTELDAQAARKAEEGA